MEIQDLLRNIWRKKWILVAATLVGVCFTLIFLQFRNDQYNSTARISTGFTVDDKISLNEEPESKDKDGETKFANLLALMKSPISYNLLSYELLLHDLESKNGFRDPKDVSASLEENNMRKLQIMIQDKIDDLVNKEFELDVRMLFTDEQIAQVKEILEFKLKNQEPLNSSETHFELVRKFLLSYGYDFKSLQESLSIDRVRGTDYVEVSFTSGNKYLSAHAANTYCDRFIRYYSTVKGQNTSESLVILEEVVQQKKDSLDNKLEVLDRYSTTDIISDADHANATRYDQLVQLESQKDEAEARIKELELTIDRLQADLNSSGRGSSTNQEIIALQQQIKDLNSEYIRSGSSDRKLSDSLAYLRGRLRNALGNINRQEQYASTSSDIREKIRDANIEHEVAENKLRQLQKRTSNIRYGLSSNRSAEDQASRLENEIEVIRAEYLRAVDKYNEAKNQQVGLNPLKVVLNASPAVYPSSLPDIYVLIFSVAACFGFGLFIAILLIISDDRIKNSSRFKRMVDLPLLAVVNELKQGVLVNPRKIFHSRKSSSRIEFFKSSIRQLRYQLESTNKKVFLFTSLRAGVGKSSIICSLAYTLSLLKKRVLIIDTNFKSNTLTRVFGSGLNEIKVVNHRMIPAKPKVLATVMENGSSRSRETEGDRISSSLNLVNITEYENIFFIGNSGVRGMSPMELLSKNDFKKFIILMSEQFDYIFLEGPALNDYADSKELTEFVQEVVTVVSAHSKIEAVDEHSLKFVQSLNRKSGGAVLNRVSSSDLTD